MAQTRLVVGHGYLGSRVSQVWRESGDQVFAVTRSPKRGGELRGEGVHAIVADVTLPETLADLPEADTVLFAVGHDRRSGAEIHAVYASGLLNVITALPSSVSRVVYISTTGVYGSAGGEWVDEQTPPNPQREGGRASLAAEQILIAHPLGRRSAILRLGGIYGPGRVPYLEQLRAGEPLAVPSQGWLNLIHVDDAARIVIAVDQRLAERQAADGPHVFCVTDGSPVQRGEYYAEVARLIGAPPPVFTAPAADSPATARAAADRRVRSDKLRQTLDLNLIYPSYREGLSAILSDPANS